MNMRMLRVVLTVAGLLAGALALDAGSLAITPIPESEPNDTAATADPLPSVLTLQAASGAISPLGDADYYSFTAPAGSRLWAFVDTGASPALFNDSGLTLFAPDGTTQIEFDDDDGTGTDCDGTFNNFLSSAIAGRTLVAGGTYFLRVTAFAGSTVSSYRLLAVVSTAETSEVEANNTAATANAIASSGTPIGVRNAAIGVIGDVNYYSVVAPAGSTIFISADADPERNGGTDLVVDLIQPDGTTLILSVDSSDSSGFPFPPAESYCFNVTTTGTYYVRVSGFTSMTKTTTGTYSLAVALGGLPVTPTPPPTSTLTPSATSTPIVGGPSPTPTPTLTQTIPAATATATPTATATAAASSTPIGGIVPSNIPTLSFPMLLLMGLGLISAAFVLIRRS
jgi:hypothetical protein